MTFRAKPVVKRAPRSSWDSRDRRNFFLNLGFGLVVLLALVILLVVVAFTYYDTHLASVASVDGQSITKDELNDRVAIESWRLTEADSRIRTEKNAGRLTDAQAQQQAQGVTQQRNQVDAIALERLIDNRIQAKLIAGEGIAITDADVDARLTTEATTPETRHAYAIEIAPAVDSGATGPTPAQKTAAKDKADAALKDLQSGTPWDSVAKTVSTDASTAPQAGDLGWLQADDTQTDEGLLTALFAAQPNQPTTVIEGTDGIYRIGRVSEVAATSVDGAYLDKIKNGGVDLVKYRAVVRGDVIRQKLEDKVVADAIKPGPQRQVAEIYLSEATAALPATAVKVRHILYSPKDDPSAASKGDIPETDPSWAKAQSDAAIAYAKLKADPSQFDAIARAESDEQSARGGAGTGGLLPGYVSADSTYVESFSKPILDSNGSDGQIIAPIKTEFGWHIVQIVSHRPAMVDLKQRVDGGADFAKLAQDISEGAEAKQGGDLGWIAKGQLTTKLVEAIFATPIGKTSEVVTITGDGTYLFKVLAEEQRTPAGRQLEQIKSSAFSDWYTPKKDAAKIERVPATPTSS
jgi:parvulin-like peptidyl-prolyl isomerase